MNKSGDRRNSIREEPLADLHISLRTKVCFHSPISVVVKAVCCAKSQQADGIQKSTSINLDVDDIFLRDTIEGKFQLVNHSKNSS